MKVVNEIKKLHENVSCWILHQMEEENDECEIENSTFWIFNFL